MGLEASHSSDGMILTQRKFTQDLLAAYGNVNLKSVSTTLPQNLKLLPDQGEPLSYATVYRTIIGKLNFLTNTRPDISYACSNTKPIYARSLTIIFSGSTTCSSIYFWYTWTMYLIKSFSLLEVTSFF